MSTVRADSGHRQAATINDSPALPGVQKATELQVNMTAQRTAVTVNSHQEQLTGKDLASFTATVTALQGMLQRLQPTVTNERREMEVSVAEPHGPLLLSTIGQYEAAHPAPVVSNQPVYSQTVQAGQHNSQHPDRHAGRNNGLPRRRRPQAACNDFSRTGNGQQEYRACSRPTCFQAAAVPAYSEPHGHSASYGRSQCLPSSCDREVGLQHHGNMSPYADYYQHWNESARVMAPRLNNDPSPRTLPQTSSNQP